MNNAKKEYVSPEVNVISVDKDVITTSGEPPYGNLPGSGSGGQSTPTVPTNGGGNWGE